MGTTVGSFFLKNRGASIVLQQGARIKCGNTLFSVRYPDRGRYQATYEELQKRYLGALLTKTDAKVMSTHATPVISRGRIGNYLDLEHLGSGGFGDVCLLAHFQSGRLFAAKRFRSGRGHPDAIRQEMELLKHLRHPNIIGYVESVQVGEDVVMVMEHAPCGHLGEQPLMRTVNMLEAIRQAVSAIEYLHKNNVVHRDLKPNNIVVHSQIPISVKVIDFGVSKIGQRMDTPAGTVIYMAPEVVSRPGGYTKAVDIWSLGLTLLEILGGLPEREAVAFQNHQSQREFSTYLKAVQCSLEVVRDGKVAKLLRLMLNPDPNARGTASQCIRAIDETKASFMGNFMENPARGLPPPVRPIEAQGRDQGRTAGARPQHLAVPPSAFLPVPMDIDSPC
ncbi:MAG: hypothetical protein M1838_003947 [Thelocarpon superellum]|nr:MAG: hypothetical protein M1838_003947 [Thelocarpon superellum]